MSKIDKDFGYAIKHIIKKKGFAEYQIANLIKGKKGRNLSPEYFSQILNGANWYLDYVWQVIKALNASVMIDSHGLHVMSEDEIKIMDSKISMAKEINDVLKRHSSDNPKQSNKSHH